MYHHFSLMSKLGVNINWKEQQKVHRLLWVIRIKNSSETGLFRKVWEPLWHILHVTPWFGPWETIISVHGAARTPVTAFQPDYNFFIFFTVAVAPVEGARVTVSGSAAAAAVFFVGGDPYARTDLVSAAWSPDAYYSSISSTDARGV